MVFYSRYYIHEILLVFFTFLALAAGWRYWRSRKLGWALLAGAGVGLMHATKETFVITLAAAALALGLNQLWNRWLDAAAPRHSRLASISVTSRRLSPSGLAWRWSCSPPSSPTPPARSIRCGPICPGCTVPRALRRISIPGISICTGCSSFTSAKGPVWSEALILVLAVVGAWAAFARKGLADASASFVRFLALYTLALTAAYSLISYKTPWCLLSFWHGMILLAGVGAAWLVRRAQAAGSCGSALGLVLLAGAGHLAWQAWLASTTYAADPRNPYVYAQTSPDLLNLVRQVEALAQVASPGHATWWSK